MLDRTQAPPFIEPSHFPIKKVVSNILQNGIPFHRLNAGKQELLRIEIIFKAGKWYENINGQSFFAGKLLGEGTKRFSSTEINKLFERNGAFFEFAPGLDFINFNIYCLNRNLNNILPLIYDILSFPTFPSKELEIIRNLQIQNLRVNLEKSNFLASRIFRESLYGSKHPYGRRTEIVDLEGITQSNLIDYFDKNIQNNFEIIVSGKINQEISTTLENFFNKFKASDFSQPAHRQSRSKQNIYISKDKSLQTSLKIGMTTIPKTHPDYFHLLIFNEILGGYFGSRLMQKIREEKGYTYGIHSSIVPLVNSTHFQISSDVIKKKKDEAISGIYDEIKLLIDQPVPWKELKTVVNFFKGSFLSNINTPYSLADKFKSIYFHSLNYDFYVKMFESLDSMTPDSLNDFVRKNFSIEDFLEVAVG